MVITRRTFLKTGALGAAAMPLWEPALQAAARQTLERRGPSQKVIVIGAGLAGLGAAYQLAEAGHDVRVLEAQRRAGGRVQTLRDFSEDLCAEAGATRIPSYHDFTLKYCKLFGLDLDPFLPPGAAVYYIRGQRVVIRPGQKAEWPLALAPQERDLDLASLLERAYRGLGASFGDPTSPSWPPEALWKYDGMGLSEFLREQGFSDDAIHLRRAALGLWDDSSERESALRSLSARALERPGVVYYKIRGGNDRLPRAFALRLADRIRYSSPVIRIERQDGGVRITVNEAGGRQTLPADRAVLAVPFSLLRRIEVVPPFSAEKTRAIRELTYTSSSKVFLQTRSRFWTEAGLNGFGYTDLLDYMQVWELGHSQPGPRGLLVGYTKRSASRQISSLDEAQRITVTLEAVAKVHPELRRHFEGGRSKCWDEDPWARGAWAISRPGDVRRLDPHIARPEGRIHFAGEHASPWRGGWMQGALESGERVAKEINSP